MPDCKIARCAARRRRLHVCSMACPAHPLSGSCRLRGCQASKRPHQAGKCEGVGVDEGGGALVHPATVDTLRGSAASLPSGEEAVAGTSLHGWCWACAGTLGHTRHAQRLPARDGCASRRMHNCESGCTNGCRAAGAEQHVLMACAAGQPAVPHHEQDAAVAKGEEQQQGGAPGAGYWVQPVRWAAAKRPNRCGAFGTTRGAGVARNQWWPCDTADGWSAGPGSCRPSRAHASSH